MRGLLRNFFALFGIKVSLLSSLKKDDREDPFIMQKKLVADSNDNLTIFDVGAFVGNIAVFYKELFPKATLYCFEPFPDSFSKLTQKTSGYKDINVFNYGVGETNGKSIFHSNKFAPTNSILPTHEEGNKTWNTDRLTTQETVDIEVITIDSFVEKYKIKKIDILKLDVQGAEYLVLKGAKKTLESGIVRLIYTEILTMPSYRGQKEFDEILSMLRSFGFELFNLYNLSLTDNGQLRQVDAIFIKSSGN